MGDFSITLPRRDVDWFELSLSLASTGHAWGHSLRYSQKLLSPLQFRSGYPGGQLFAYEEHRQVTVPEGRVQRNPLTSEQIL